MDINFRFEVGGIVYYNGPFNGSVPRFRIIARSAFDRGEVLPFICYRVRQLFDHVEYERREGISQTELEIGENELSETVPGERRYETDCNRS